MARRANALGSGALLLGLALLAGRPANAGDVSVKLDFGSGFSIKDGSGTVERLRVDEATGNISRNGALFVHTTGGEQHVRRDERGNECDDWLQQRRSG